MIAVLAIGCAGAQKPATVIVAPPAASECDAHQLAILHDGDARAAPWSIAAHRAKNFPDGKVAWLMKEASYQSFVVKTGAKEWGRCDDTGCYVFAAPATVIHDAVERSMSNGHHDPAVIGKALGLPAANFDGPLRMMIFDVDKNGACVRLPVDSDPGVWKCPDPCRH